MIKRSFRTLKTGRYFLSEEPTKDHKEIWFVLHGYSNLASSFLQQFPLIPGVLLVAPEGLNRFYRQGYSGKIGATWMTSEERSEEIKDYVEYLDGIFSELSLSLRNDVHVNILGFSQGAATASRWVSMGKMNADKLILWAGIFPPDLGLGAALTKKNLSTVFVIGEDDEFIKEADITEHEKFLKEENINYKLIRYKGGHKINAEVFSFLASPTPIV